MAGKRTAAEIAEDTLRRWRCERLTEAGYPQEEAFLLACRADVDLHAACELLARGCPLGVALKILT